MNLLDKMENIRNLPEHKPYEICYDMNREKGMLIRGENTKETYG